MAAEVPSTRAVLALRAAGVEFSAHAYPYEDRGGTRVAASALGVPEPQVVKTLVFEDDRKKPLLVLMPGDREVSAKALARLLGAQAVKPCVPAVAERHTGYQVGGTSPFGTRKALPVYIERSVLDLDAVFLNGGRRGLLLRLDPKVAAVVLGAIPVEVGR